MQRENSEVEQITKQFSLLIIIEISAFEGLCTGPQRLRREQHRKKGAMVCVLLGQCNEAVRGTLVGDQTAQGSPEADLTAASTPL